ncbi:MAG: FAD-dependent oxidoreductase [Bacteroidia bacterium]
MNLSYWERDTLLADPDVLVIGSGIVGLHAALVLRERQPALRVCVAERGALPSGASTKNAGFACFGSMTELLEDRDAHGEAAMLALVARRWEGLRRLRKRLGNQALQYAALGGYELFGPADAASYAACRAEMDTLNHHLHGITGLKATFRPAHRQIDALGLGQTRHLIRNAAEGQLHPGRMIGALLDRCRRAGVQVCTGLAVQAIADSGDRVQVSLPGGTTWTCRAVVVATNGFARQLLPDLDLRPARNQVLVTTPIAGLRLRGTFHYDRGYVYFRNIGTDRVLLGGFRHLDPVGETTDAFGETDLIQTAQETFLREVVLPQHPQAKIDMRWSGILGLGSQREPVLRQVSRRVVAAVRLGGMGVAIGSLLGEEAAQLLIETALD